jgi:hypothetical protein
MVFSAAFFIVAYGCMRPKDTTRQAMPTRSEALVLAISHLSNQKLVDQDFRMTSSETKDEWVFWFEYLPSTPDATIILIVKKNGGTILQGP